MAPRNLSLIARSSPSKRPVNSGMTVLELLVTLIITGAMMALTIPGLQSLVDRQRVSAATNSILGLMQLARGEALSRGPVFLCDAKHGCGTFDTTSHLALFRADPAELSTLPTSDAEPIASLRLPPGTEVSWSRFRGSALLFHNTGILHFQNGSFFICGNDHATRIIMSWSGRARTAKVPVRGNCV
jgi:type IV fimbrial biogenesis protein FimT